MLCAMHRVTRPRRRWRRAPGAGHLAIALDGFRHTGSTTELTARR